MIRALVVALLVGTITACSSTASPPRAGTTSSPVVVASPTPTPAPTTAPPSPTSTGRHVNPVLGFAVTLPPPWRVTECLSRIETTREPVFIGQDVLTWHSVADEQDLGASGGIRATGAFAWVILIMVQTSSQSVAAYATDRAGGIGGQVQMTTIDGKPAARLTDAAGNAQAYYVANAGRMYAVSLTQGFETRPQLVSDATFDAIARSMTFVTPAARPTPTPEPVVTAAVEAVADAVAAAFAASDADRLRDLMTPKCWFTAGYYQSEGAAASRDKVAAGLRSSFAQGLKVTVEPRPIRTNPPMPGSFWIWSTWSAYGTPPQTTPRSSVQLVFDQIDGRWYWVGALFNAAR
ncbi:MAG TPA: hypothetical protein VGS17_11315 [Candidatus Limnocylindria bacterium]|nr:hypothetical protein [Candidatus Limnocylindria bacterium]